MSGCTFTMCCCPRGNDITQFFRVYYLSLSLSLSLFFFSVYLFINLFIQLFIHLPFIDLFVHPSIYPFIDPFTNSSIHSSIRWFQPDCSVDCNASDLEPKTIDTLVVNYCMSSWPSGICWRHKCKIASLLNVMQLVQKLT